MRPDISLDAITSTAGQSLDSQTFAKFYNCPLGPNRQNKSYSSAWVNGVSVRSNFTQTILGHDKSQQHISASLSYNNWLQGNTIDTLLKSEIDSKITFWRDVLHRIINVIITLVSCNLPLRGHDSDSGNFMAISRLLYNYDATLKDLLLKPKGEIDYLSPTIQNEIISLLENDDNVPKEIKICESFLGFIGATDCSAAGLKTVILNLTREYGIDLTKCRGQGYDGANVMSGVYGGLQTLIKEHAPNADYVQCAAHALNLVLNDAARHVREVSTFFDNLEKIYTFFGNRIKRWAMLSDDSSEKYLITLRKVCPTRWSSRNDALLAVKKFCLLIMKTLYQLNLISNKKYEQSFDFLVLVTFFSSLFEIINPVSTALQHQNNDLQKSSIIAVLPVSTSANERSFSTLRRLKTYPRFTIKEDCLNRLASSNIHRNLKLNVDSISNEFFFLDELCY
nr:unnamed protein product [Callosobruchus analis]